ncbi:hypothetical protein PAXRUDRAFT_158216, partial [Paxillus rubicundulus Ve08.2h10]
KAPHTTLINTAAFALTCCLEGTVQFSLHLHSDDESKLHTPSAEADPVDFSAVLLDYCGFQQKQNLAWNHIISLHH